MWLNVVLTPGSLHRSQSSGTGPSVNCGFVDPFAPRRVGTRGKILLIEPQEVNVHRGPVPGAPTSGTPRESQAKFRDGAVWGLKKGPVVTGPAGSVFGDNSFYQKNLYTRRGGSACD